MQRTISRKEAATAREALASLEKRYSQGKITRGIYVSQRERLHDILRMPVAENTAVKTNTRSWFARNFINNSAAPVGYFAFEQGLPLYGRQFPTDAIQSPVTVGNDMSKVRQGMLNLATNEYWNSNDIMMQLKAQSQPVANQAQATNSFYNQAIRHANGLNAGLGSTRGASSEAILANLQASAEVQAALRALSASVNILIRERVANGASPSEARQELINLAIASGAKLTGMGYDANDAAAIVSRLVKGEITEMQAVYEMASDLREANKILNSLGSRAHSSIRPGSGLLDQIYSTPLPGRERFIGQDYNPSNMRPRVASLNMPFGTLDLPTLRAMAKQATEQGDENKVTQLMEAIEMRQNAMQSVRRGGKTSQQGQPASGLSPEFQSRALNFSPVAQQAIQRQKPDMATVLDDVFTIDGNLYFNPQAGGQIYLNNDFRTATANNDASMIRPQGAFTVFGMSPAGLENLNAIKQALLYTMANPSWDDQDKAYLEYLLGVMQTQIDFLSTAPVVQSSANQFQQTNTVQQTTQQSQVVQQKNNIANQLNPEQNAQNKSQKKELNLKPINKGGGGLPGGGRSWLDL